MGKALLLFACAVLARGSTNEAIATKDRAHLAYLAGNYAEAEAGYRQALDQFGDEGGLDRAVAYENLGVALRAQGRCAEAQPILEDALRQIDQLAGPESPDTTQAMHNLAALYYSAGRLEEAASLSLRAGRPANPVAAAAWYANLAAAAIAGHRLDAAEDFARRGLSLADESLPPNHRFRATLLNNLAQVCRFTGRYTEAERLYMQALAIWRETVGPDHPDYARGLLNLGAFYSDRAREILGKPSSPTFSFF